MMTLFMVKQCPTMRNYWMLNYSRDFIRNAEQVRVIKSAQFRWIERQDQSYLIKSNFFLFQVFLKKNNWQTQPLYYLFLSFQTNITILTTNMYMWKMSIQNAVPGFELTTFGTWVSSHNHNWNIFLLLSISTEIVDTSVRLAEYFCTRLFRISTSVTRLSNLLDFGQIFKAFRNN